MERLSRAFATTVDCQMAWVNSASTSMLLNSSSLISGRFDRRIHRLSDISSVAAFEVDHPATVAVKLADLVRNCRQTCVFWRSISIGGLVETLESERFDSGSLEFGSDAVCKGREPFNLDSAPVRNLDLSPVPQPHVDPYAGLGGYAHPRMFVQTMASLRRARLQTGRVTSCLGQLCLWVVTIVPLIGIWGCTGSVSGPGQSVPPPSTTYSISGTISPNAGGSGATVTLSGAASATSTTNTSGSYTFTGLVNGTYAVTPSNTGYTFSPGSQSVTISGSNVIGLNFTATAPVAHSVTLNWSGSSSSVVGYNIYRSPVSGGPYTKMNSSVITLLTYTDTTVQAGQVYYYVVTSMNSNNVESSYSNELSATIPTP